MQIEDTEDTDICIFTLLNQIWFSGIQSAGLKGGARRPAEGNAAFPQQQPKGAREAGSREDEDRTAENGETDEKAATTGAQGEETGAKAKYAYVICLWGSGLRYTTLLRASSLGLHSRVWGGCGRPSRNGSPGERRNRVLA